MKILLQLLLFVASFVIVHGGHIQKVVGVKDASGQCICSVQLSHVSFPVRKVEQLEGDFFNLTDHLQNILNKIYTFHWVVTDGIANLTELDKRAKYAKDYGAHIDLEFNKLILEITTLDTIAKKISENATSTENKEVINRLIKEISGMTDLVNSMETRDQNNIITAQREVNTLRKKLIECEEQIGIVPTSVPDKASGPDKESVPERTVFGTCQHEGIMSVNGPVLVKQNWKGTHFKAGSWGKDFALGTKLKDHYWVFPTNKDFRTLETFRLYASYKNLMLYFPIKEFSLRGNKEECEHCGQGGGVVFYNGSFFYNCFNSRALCKMDPNSLRLLRRDLEGNDPDSFNNIFSYKGVKYQDMDMAGDEKGLWMIYSSSKAQGNIVIREVDPDNLKVGKLWTTTQPKKEATNSFMICGVLYATKRVNTSHEEIFYYYDTNTAQEGNVQIFLEKVLPTMQSLNYNPNDENLYMFNDGYLVYYNVTFKNHIATAERQASDSTGGQNGLHDRVQADVGKQDQIPGLASEDWTNANNEVISQSHHGSESTIARKDRYNKQKQVKVK